jgi:hypothetical protein
MDAMPRPVGRPSLNIKPMFVRVGKGVPEKIDRALRPKETRAAFIRTAVEHELQRREGELASKKKPGRK